MRIRDISQPLGNGTAVWPGDRPVDIGWSLRRSAGDSVNVAKLATSVHAGTHADGFLHVLDGGETIEQMPLDAYVGRCTVVHAVGCDVVAAEHVAGIDLQATQRILFRTRAHVDPGEFPRPFAHIDPALARTLGAAGVRLLGTDAPSVDPVDSKTLDAHHALMGARIAILESLLLDDVEPGDYTLIALPLRLRGADSAPVRAVLLDGRLEDT